MNGFGRVTLLISCIILMYGCHSKNLGIPEFKLLDETMPQGYVVVQPPSEAFHLLEQAVNNTPKAKLLVLDESSGLITWLVRSEVGEKRKGRESESLGEPVLAVGTDEWDNVWSFGDAKRARSTTADYVVCTVYIRPDGEGSRVQVRRAWRRYGQVFLGMPQAWARESDMLTRAGLRVSSQWFSE